MYINKTSTFKSLQIEEKHVHEKMGKSDSSFHVLYSVFTIFCGDFRISLKYGVYRYNNVYSMGQIYERKLFRSWLVLH